MKKLILISAIVLGIFIIILGACKEKPVESLRSADPVKDGYVPDEVTAVKVAEAIWLPLFGDAIYDKKPFRAELKNDSVWIVQGTLGRGIALY